MPLSAARGAASLATALDALDQLWVITPEDIESGWMDIMVKRLFMELDRQLRAVENSKVDKATSQPPLAERVQNARILSSLEQTMAKLARLEKDRDARNERKGKVSRANARKDLQRKAARANERAKPGAVSEEPDR